MHDGVGVLKALAERLIQRHARDLLARCRIHQHQRVDIDSHFARRIADAEVIEAMKSVGPELNAGADLAELRRFLEHEAGKAFLSEAERRGQPADAAAGDEDALSGGHRCLFPLPRA